MAEYAALILEFVNVVVKSALRARDFNQIGKWPKFFLPREGKYIQDYNIEVWPGYLSTSRLLADGFFLNVDTCTKFINSETVFDRIQTLRKTMSEAQIASRYDSSNLDAPRVTVITRYGPDKVRSYQVDGLDTKLTPSTYSFKVKGKGAQKDQTMTMVQYLATVHNVRLKYPNQPLLYVNKLDTRIYLATEFCYEASLPENFTSDSRKMKALQDYKISNPTDRFQRIEKFL